MELDFSREQVNYFIIRFENLEEIKVNICDVVYFNLGEITCVDKNDGIFSTENVEMIINEGANNYYMTYGLTSDLTSFQRILQRLDITSIEISTSTDRYEIFVPYEEDEKGFNSLSTSQMVNGKLVVSISK